MGWDLNWFFYIMLRDIFFLFSHLAGLPYNAVLVHCTRSSVCLKGLIGSEIQTSLCWTSCVLWYGTVAAQRKGALFSVNKGALWVGGGLVSFPHLLPFIIDSLDFQSHGSTGTIKYM